MTFPEVGADRAPARRRPLLLAASAAGLAVALAGCSSGTPTSARSSTSTTTTSAPSTSSTTSTPSTSPGADGKGGDSSGGGSSGGGSSTTTSTPSSTTTAPSGAPVCQPGQLQFTAQQSQGAAGTETGGYFMVDTASTPCLMEGYPGMQLLGSGGTKLPTDVVRGWSEQFPQAAANQAPVRVILAQGQKAAFDYAFSDVPVGNETSCPTSSDSEITPPNSYNFATVALQIAPCSGGTIHVSPVFVP